MFQRLTLAAGGNPIAINLSGDDLYDIEVIREAVNAFLN
jgi:hypothetical protein